jgi:dipeptidyl aminopeptidase/acylaminoacyl peptidase
MPLPRPPSLPSLLAGLLALAAIPALSAQTAPPRFPASEDLRHTRAVGDPQLSPDAKQALIAVTESTADGAKSHLWLVDIAGNASRQLTFSPAGEKAGEGRGESHGRWMPDSSAVLFLAKRGENAQVYRLPMSGGEAVAYDLKIVPLPVAEDGVSANAPAAKGADKSEAKPDAKPEPQPLDVDDFEISADGRWLAVLAKDPETAAEKKKAADKDDAEFVDHDPHGVRLYLQALDASGAAVGSLVRAEIAPDVQGIAWAPRSAKLAVVTELPNNVGDLHPARSAWVIERSGDSWKTAPLTKVPATVEEHIVWTRDEASLLILAQAQQDAPPGISNLYISDGRTGETHPLSRDFAGTIRQVVAADDNSALVAVTEGMVAAAAQFPLAGGGPTTLKFDLSAVGNLSTNAARSGWLYEESSSGTPPQLCFARTLSAGCTKLNTPAATPSDWRAVAAQTLKWKSGDFTIEGILYLPPQAKDGGKVPLVVDVHGGPTGQFVDSYSAFAQFLVGQGWALLETNPRGSTGYGSAFAAANKNDLGGGDYRDIMAGVDTVLAKFPIDASKMALIGYSYGGEMAGFVEGKTDRFRAIVSGAPVIDQMSEYGTEASSYYDRWWYGYPWEHEADAWRQSPLAGVVHAKTPFLLLQGKDDTTDPAGQSEEMYRALRQHGVTVELVEYPRENHGPLVLGMFGYPSREPWHGLDARKRLVKFIGKQFAAGDQKR